VKGRGVGRATRGNAMPVLNCASQALYTAKVIQTEFIIAYSVHANWLFRPIIWHMLPVCACLLLVPCVIACVRACLRMCVRACVRACSRACVRAYADMSAVSLRPCPLVLDMVTWTGRAEPPPLVPGKWWEGRRR
jgi:hypothetical protein